MGVSIRFLLGFRIYCLGFVELRVSLGPDGFCFAGRCRWSFYPLLEFACVRALGGTKCDV